MTIEAVGRLMHKVFKASDGFLLHRVRGWFQSETVDYVAPVRLTETISTRICPSTIKPIRSVLARDGGRPLVKVVSAGRIRFGAFPFPHTILIGGGCLTPPAYTIDGNGTAKIQKHSHWLSRSIQCVIKLDGATIQTEHQ